MSKMNPPYYAVIFTSKLKSNIDGYDKTARKMYDLATKQPGFLGFKSVREEIGITISYWESIDAITSWKENIQHQAAQVKGIEDWYASYEVEICQVQRKYSL